MQNVSQSPKVAGRLARPDASLRFSDLSSCRVNVRFGACQDRTTSAEMGAKPKWA